MESSKKFMLVLGGMVVALLLIPVAMYGWQSYKSWRFQRTLNEFSEEWLRTAELDRQAAMADTYGGKTPQETLKMYIEAVEKGDYELASKYFIKENQKRELETFVGAEQVDINNIQNLLREAMKKGGSFSLNKEGYIIHDPIFVELKLYPNGVWKLVKI